MMSKLSNPFQNTVFLTSAAKVPQLPEDEGFEVAFVGRSNAGKSSALNCLTAQKGLAKTSKTPGRTQLINLFDTGLDNRRLVDLPGYGFAKVPASVKQQWQAQLTRYLEERQSLRGLVVLMDSRHPLKESDCMMITWALDHNLPVHILLTKADKLTHQEKQKVLVKVKRAYEALEKQVTIQLFSAPKFIGLDVLINRISTWFELDKSSD